MAKKTSSPAHRQYSAPMLDGPDRAPSRAMLHPVGFSNKDFQKSIIGVASTWSMVTPCNMHIDGLAKESVKGVDAAGERVSSSIPSPFRTGFRWEPRE